MQIKPRLEMLEPILGRYSVNQLSNMTGVSRMTIDKVLRGDPVEKRILYKIAEGLNIPHVDVITHYSDLNKN